MKRKRREVFHIRSIVKILRLIIIFSMTVSSILLIFEPVQSEDNTAPVLDAIGNKSVDELTELAFTATATDADLPPQTLSFYLSGNPTGASITSGGAFSWTPTEAQGPGSYPFDVCVSDGSLSDCETITVTVVEVNSPPYLNAIGDKHAKMLYELNFTVTAEDSDIPENTLTYSLLSAPAGAIITTGGEFSWTPAANQGPADHTFSIEVCDGGSPVYCDQETITIFVTENHAPVAVNLSYITKENQGGSIPVSLGVLHFATDEDGDPLTAVLVSDVTHGTLTLNSDGSFSYYPFANFSGTDSFVYKVNDGYSDSNEATATIIVEPIPTKPPSTPVLVSPAKNALLFDLKPRLDWKNSRLPSGTIFDHYLLQVAKDNQFTDMVLEQSITDINDSEYTLQTELQTNTKYYWRVMAFNSNNSSWSEVRYFRVAMLPPVLEAPADGAQLDNLRPLFDWQDVDGASSYTIQISTNSSLMKPFISKTVAISEYLPTSDLLAGKVLYWRVRANGNNGPSAWSEVRLLTSPLPPSRPSLLSPGNKALVTDLRPRLDWSSSTLPLGTEFDYYQLQVADNSGFMAPVIDIKLYDQLISEYTLGVDLQPNSVYYWRVRAYNTAEQYRSWSVVRYFRVAILPPVLVSPADGALLDNLRPLLDWQDVDGASSYTIQVSTNSSLKKPFISKTVGISEYLPTSDLPTGKVLYWRVRANGNNGPSAWSEVRSMIKFLP